MKKHSGSINFSVCEGLGEALKNLAEKEGISGVDAYASLLGYTVYATKKIGFNRETFFENIKEVWGRIEEMKAEIDEKKSTKNP